MFAGRTNNDMLRLIMAVKGRFPVRMIRAHLKSYEMLQLDPHFEGENTASSRFKQLDIDPVSKKPVLKFVDVPMTPTRDLGAILRQNKVRLSILLSLTFFH
jgi:hypothetical protein